MSSTLSVPRGAAQTLLNGFDRTRAQKTLLKLCSENFTGRRIGTPGHDLAQGWLLDQMADIGLSTQVFPFTIDASVLALRTSPQFTAFDTGGIPRHLEYRTEFQEHPQSAMQKTFVEGIVHRDSNGSHLDNGWIILDTLPTPEIAHQMWQAGVVGILLPQRVGPNGYLPKRVMARARLPLPVISVHADMLSQMEGQHVRADMPLEAVSVEGGHVLGGLMGIDPTLIDMPLLVGAHFDGVGDDISGYRLPGAADNAAGVAVVLEVARVIAQSGQQPRRPILFAAFDGEEINALGSYAYAEFLKTQAKTPIVINLDGAARFHEAVWAELSENADGLIQALDLAGEWLEIPLTAGAVGSDNRRYAQAGFPSVGLALGGIGGHTPADTVEQVDLDAMMLAGRLLLATIWQLAF